MSAQEIMKAYELALQLISDIGWKLSLEEISDIVDHGLDGDLEWLQEVEA